MLYPVGTAIYPPYTKSKIPPFLLVYIQTLFAQKYFNINTYNLLQEINTYIHTYFFVYIIMILV